MHGVVTAIGSAFQAYQPLVLNTSLSPQYLSRTLFIYAEPRGLLTFSPFLCYLQCFKHFLTKKMKVLDISKQS